MSEIVILTQIFCAEKTFDHSMVLISFQSNQKDYLFYIILLVFYTTQWPTVQLYRTVLKKWWRGHIYLFSAIEPSHVLKD